MRAAWVAQGPVAAEEGLRLGRQVLAHAHALARALAARVGGDMAVVLE